MFQEFDVDGDGVVTFAEFEAGMARKRKEAEEKKLTPTPHSEKPAALGPQENLPGRLNENLTKE